MSKSERRNRRELNAKPATSPDDDDDAFDRGELEESAEARRKREEWERYHARAMRERDELRRKMFTTYLLWTICPHKACQRAKACVGDDTEECRRERWRVAVPDEVRAELAKICELVSEGHSMDDACRLAHEDMMMREKLIAKLEALHPRREPKDDFTPEDFTPEAPAEEPPSPARGPRIRRI